MKKIIKFQFFSMLVLVGVPLAGLAISSFLSFFFDFERFWFTAIFFLGGPLTDAFIRITVWRKGNISKTRNNVEESAVKIYFATSIVEILFVVICVLLYLL